MQSKYACPIHGCSETSNRLFNIKRHIQRRHPASEIPKSLPKVLVTESRHQGTSAVVENRNSDLQNEYSRADEAQDSAPHSGFEHESMNTAVTSCLDSSTPIAKGNPGRFAAPLARNPTLNCHAPGSQYHLAHRADQNSVSVLQDQVKNLQMQLEDAQAEIMVLRSALKNQSYQQKLNLSYIAQYVGHLLDADNAVNCG